MPCMFDSRLYEESLDSLFCILANPPSAVVGNFLKVISLSREGPSIFELIDDYQSYQKKIPVRDARSDGLTGSNTWLNCVREGA